VLQRNKNKVVCCKTPNANGQIEKKKMKNYIYHPLWLSGLVLMLLVALSFVPDGMDIGGLTLKRMDILADVRRDAAPVDTLAALPELRPDSVDLMLPDTTGQADSAVARVVLPPKDSSYFGGQIEDYSPEQQGLGRFFEAVRNIPKGKTVRVAWYGDSFVEGDILLGDLRDSLQSIWGGKGVGFVPITSEVAQFKRTLKHNFRGWKSYTIVERNAPHPPFGLNGHAYVPSADAKVHYEGADYFHNTRRWGNVRLFYTALNPTQMIWQNEGMGPQAVTLPAQGSRLKQWTWERPGSIRAFAMRFPQPDGFVAYGASLEDGPGIYFDNFSVRGNSGGPLRGMAPGFVQQFDSLQHYELVVLQVGLNAVTNSLTNIRWYKAELERTFEHLRKCFPRTPILIVSVGDRGGKVGTEVVTMQGVPAIAAMQRDLARQHGFLFYDLYHGMGGPGSMVRMANHRPRWANTDYTHLTHEGGRQVGHRFVKLFLEEFSRTK
jgi:hypothetical protein